MANRGRTQASTEERQAALLSALLSEPDLFRAARVAGVPERTASRWWHAGLKERAHQARAAVHEEAWSVARGLANEAVRVVGLALAKEAPDPAERIAERLPVATKHLELLIRLRDSDTRREDLAIRRAEVELKRNALKAGEDLLSQLVGQGWVCAPPAAPCS